MPEDLNTTATSGGDTVAPGSTAATDTLTDVTSSSANADTIAAAYRPKWDWNGPKGKASSASKVDEASKMDSGDVDILVATPDPLIEVGEGEAATTSPEPPIEAPEPGAKEVGVVDGSAVESSSGAEDFHTPQAASEVVIASTDEGAPPEGETPAHDYPEGPAVPEEHAKADEGLTPNDDLAVVDSAQAEAGAQQDGAEEDAVKEEGTKEAENAETVEQPEATEFSAEEAVDAGTIDDLPDKDEVTAIDDKAADDVDDAEPTGVTVELDTAVFSDEVSAARARIDDVLQQTGTHMGSMLSMYERFPELHEKAQAVRRSVVGWLSDDDGGKAFTGLEGYSDVETAISELRAAESELYEEKTTALRETLQKWEDFHSGNTSKIDSIAEGMSSIAGDLGPKSMAPSA